MFEPSGGIFISCLLQACGSWTFNSWCWRKDPSAALTSSFQSVVHLKVHSRPFFPTTAVELPRHFVKELMVQKCPLSPTDSSKFIARLLAQLILICFMAWWQQDYTFLVPECTECQGVKGANGRLWTMAWSVRVWKEMNNACFRTSITLMSVHACIEIN